jgi:hypothetical protein
MPFKDAKNNEVKLNRIIESIVKGKKGGWTITEIQLEKNVEIPPIFVEHSSGYKYRIRKLIGYSYRDWTVVCFQMFNEENKLIHMFTYMEGGFELERWAWKSSGVYGACLYPDAFEYIINQSLKDLLAEDQLKGGKLCLCW